VQSVLEMRRWCVSTATFNLSDTLSDSEANVAAVWQPHLINLSILSIWASDESCVAVATN